MQGLTAKQKISTARGAGFEPALQKLIFGGKVLKDEQTMSEAGVKEGGFLVCMVSKPKTVRVVEGARTQECSGCMSQRGSLLT